MYVPSNTQGDVFAWVHRHICMCARMESSSICSLSFEAGSLNPEPTALASDAHSFVLTSHHLVVPWFAGLGDSGVCLFHPLVASGLLVGLLPWLWQTTCGPIKLGPLQRDREAADLLPCMQ